MSEPVFNEEQELLILDFLLGRIVLADFVAKFGCGDFDAEELVQQALVQSLILEDSSSLERGLSLGYTLDALTLKHVPMLCKHLLLDTHYRHEDVARTLQTLRCPSSLQALVNRCDSAPSYAAAIDDGDALFRKCVWAIHDIGTPEAHAFLEQLTCSEFESVRRYSQRRLDKWNPGWRDQK